MLIFALLSEIPFDLMYGGTWFYPVHQNVIWTLLIGLLGIRAMEAVREKGKTWLYLLTCAAVTVLGFALGTLGMVDLKLSWKPSANIAYLGIPEKFLPNSLAF